MRSLLVALALVALPCAAQERLPEMRVGGGWDVRHKAGMPMLSLGVDPLSLLVWDAHLDFGLGLSHRFGNPAGWSASLGGIAVRRTDDDLGTHLNFLLGLSRCGRSLCLSYAHLSHGALLGIERGATNSGLNFVFLEYRLR